MFWREAGKHCLVNRVGALRHACDVDGDAGSIGHVKSGKFGNRALLDQLIRSQHTLQHDLRFGRHFEIDRFAFQKAHRLAQKTAGDGKLVIAKIHIHLRGEQHGGMIADGDCDLERATQRP